MRGSLQSLVPVVLIASLVGVVILALFVWLWAMRRPVAVENAGGAPRVEASATPQPRRLTYAAIGASDVEGVGADDPATQSWVVLLHAKMPPGTKFLRLGRGGIILHEANTLEVPQAVAARPDIVTLWNCVNDATRGVTLTSYLQDLEAALTRLTKETPAQILLLNLPDVSRVMPLDETQRALVRGGVRQWNAAMADAAARYAGRVTVVDLAPLDEEGLMHREYLSKDNFHPSAAGYRRLAELVWQVIEQEHLIERLSSRTP